MEPLNITNPLHYIIANNPDGVRKVFRKYNMPEPTDAEMLEATNILISQYAEKAAYDFTCVHPDRGYILQSQPDYWRKFVARYSGIINSSGAKIRDLNERLVELKTQLAITDESDIAEINLEIETVERELAAQQQNSWAGLFKENKTLVLIAVIALIIWLATRK